MDNWLRLLQAAAAEDREACIEWSLKLGYLTGEESQVRSSFFFFFHCLFIYSLPSSLLPLFPFLHLSPFHPRAPREKDNAKRTHILPNPPRNPIQPLNAPTLLIRSRQQVVGNHS